MAFNTEVLKDGRGRALRFDFSTDNFATVAYRYGTHSGKLDGANMYEARVMSVGALRRGFGLDRIAASGTVDMVLDNTDGGVDWMAYRSNMAVIARLRVRIYIVIFDPNAPTTVDAKQLGEFSIANWPKRTNAQISVQLADDIFGSLSQAAQLPTINDWYTVPSTSANNPLLNGFSLPDSYTLDTPIQLAFGEDWVRAYGHIIPNNPGSTYTDTIAGYPSTKIIVPICCTNDTATAASQSEITNLRVQLYSSSGQADGPLLDVPKTYNTPATVPPSPRTIWTVERSPSITVDGKSFTIIYLVVQCLYFNDWAARIAKVSHPAGEAAWPAGSSSIPDHAGTSGVVAPWWFWLGGYTVTGSADLIDYFNGPARVAAWYVKGVPLSALTQKTSAQQHAADVLKDLATVYAKGSGMTFDETQRLRVKAATVNSRCFGLIQPWTEQNNGQQTTEPKPLRAAITKLCQSADIDIFINWSGQVSVSADIWDLPWVQNLPNLVSIDETRIGEIEDWIPSSGERGAPYNRLYLQGGRTNPAEGPVAGAMPFQGPWTLGAGLTTSINVSDRIVEGRLEQGWRPWFQMTFIPIHWRQLEVLARQRVRFTTDLSGLRLELGDYFKLTWSRGIGGASSYAATIFQVESISLNPDNDTVEVEAMWRDELSTDKGYLLDNQFLLLRVQATGGRTITVTDGSTTVNFSSGNLVTDGVQVGDILLVQDTTTAAAEFRRYRYVRIASVSATSVTITDPSLDFAAPSGAVVTTWSIWRGATTYPTVISDPANYPNGGTMYGKVTDYSTGTYSNGDKNYLLNG